MVRQEEGHISQSDQIRSDRLLLAHRQAARERERDDDGCPGGRHDGSLCRGRALARVARAYLAAIDSTDSTDSTDSSDG